MNFSEYKCPVCDKQFKDGDDIVVCPICGAPHHRECYEADNRCAFSDKHDEGFEFGKSSDTQENPDEQSDVIICPRCKSENQKGMFYCGKCGFPLGAQDAQSQQNPQQNPQGMPFSGFGTSFSSAFDPMAGVNPQEDMGDSVTAGEISKFVQKNTPYFIRVFNNIRLFSNSRFNFCGFLFGGAYLLYRKMYKLGGILSAVMILITMAELFLSYNLVQELYSDSVTSYSDMFKVISNLSVDKQMMLVFSALFSILSFLLRIIIGAFANRWYFAHCKSEIKKIKQATDNPQKDIEAKGGVNLAIAISVMAIIVVINELPTLMQTIQ